MLIQHASEYNKLLLNKLHVTRFMLKINKKHLNKIILYVEYKKKAAKRKTRVLCVCLI